MAGTVFTTWLVGGPWFSLGLILILGTHEFGHYWACRLNNVNASLPNFIPAPPIFIAGTMGAFIIIKEPIPNRRALMEIGASGPIAGFVTAVPVLILGLMNSQVMLGSQSADEFGLFFGSSLILWGMTELVLGVNPMLTDVTITLHPLAYAGWLGMFFTALNLLPMGQLDGGHVVYSLFEKHHTWVARLFFIAMFPLGYFWSGWFIWAVLVFLLGLKHPPLIDESAPLGRNHRYIGYASILILILTFVPVPFDLLR
ncbi:MAG: site-2 protease family protein [Nitrospinaceae bacterium]|nr:site-2 protease family protein [Nitrospinaceae bacterium]NIU42923.1 site-2 protease family protein [Nitrospinaceae bacterium]NIU94999.1 site-2 protease family protein [Nitrospinaceae bacterium]NIW57696.1 site-2 protease family protein [Nitrospinaceae bacterium]